MYVTQVTFPLLRDNFLKILCSNGLLVASKLDVELRILVNKNYKIVIIIKITTKKEDFFESKIEKEARFDIFQGFGWIFLRFTAITKRRSLILRQKRIILFYSAI